MNITESTPDQERMGLIEAVTNDAAHYLGIDLENDSPVSVMETVNATITSMVFGEPTDIPADEEPDLLLGCIWGAQMRRQFDWHWADVVIDDDIKEVALISPKREMIIFPFWFVGACLNKECICTVMLAFNMFLEEGTIDDLRDGAYEDIMESIHHIVPPYTLESNG